MPEQRQRRKAGHVLPFQYAAIRDRKETLKYEWLN